MPDLTHRDVASRFALRGHPAVLAGVGGLLTGLVLGIGAGSVLDAGSGGDGQGPRYGSVVELARRAGCEATLSTVPARPPALHAGDCTTPDGIRVQFRVFGSMEQAMGWGSAAAESDTGPADVLEYGPGWVVRIVDARRDRANRILAGLS